ncbi:LolA-like outer membrane lipoprotein chaperone [Helicobacter canadensis]|uniref:Outer membrane lipoprotein carrier protein n=1 Tax=Helicobacter canadensis MIT 98-5491 TaxID=537970 RepID=C5ZX98_9HELI|nr:LolA-like outer membrane lipoprotein chaperone [Helicobacter canadensis]EES89766.1 outer membrane lipoprotein carrier protein [Helicobacter canadensis MIT 98-5491]EFR48562.1 outer membrane lipoprotein carrier protein LolA [Helicobacter canadensis MIT 98-5491]STO99805.1 outer-membrane lipoprotein carrier protein precursor [Helicobacter canadensis]
MLLKILLIFLLFLSFLNAQEIRTLQSMQANFTQKLISQNSTILYKGEFFALAPHFVLWKYESPIPKEVYINKDSMIIYEPKLEQAIYSTLKENLDILTLIKEAKLVKENYYTAEILGQTYHLFFDKGILKQITFMDAVGNSVEILFENIQTNHKLNLQIFEFKPTSNLDILYN